MEQKRNEAINLTESEQSQALRHGLKAVVASLRTVDILLGKKPENTEIQDLLKLSQGSLSEMIAGLRDSQATAGVLTQSESSREVSQAEELGK